MFSALLLAAGASSRMGLLKALLPWNGRTLLASQIEQTDRSGIDELVVVLGFGHERLRPVIEATIPASRLAIKIVHNQHYSLGRSSSIRLGIQALSPESRGVVIMGVDQPVREKTLKQLITDLSDGEIRIPTFQGKKGHPPAFSASYFPALGQVSEEGEGLREVLRQYRHCINCIETGQPQVLLNLNHQRDYISAIRAGMDVY